MALASLGIAARGVRETLCSMRPANRKALRSVRGLRFGRDRDQLRELRDNLKFPTISGRLSPVLALKLLRLLFLRTAEASKATSGGAHWPSFGC